MSRCLVADLGLVPYHRAWQLQRRLVERRKAGEIPDVLLLLEHPPVFTLGRGARPEHVLWDEAELARRGIERVSVDRGGDVTYHGPGQLVGYPILDLKRRGGDLRRYLRDLEEVLLRALLSFGIEGRREPGYTGVWVGTAKIASIGVKISRFVSSHGFALNVAPALTPFQGIIPCGIRDVTMTSLAHLLGRPPEMARVKQEVGHCFAEVFQLELEDATGAPEWPGER